MKKVITAFVGAIAAFTLTQGTVAFASTTSPHKATVSHTTSKKSVPPKKKPPTKVTPVAAPAIDWTPGVVSGIHVDPVKTPTKENWNVTGNPTFFLDSLTADFGSNKVPISGHMTSDYTGDLTIWVEHGDLTHVYSVPVVDNKFSCTILLPLSGDNYVFVSVPTAGPSQIFSVGNDYVETFVQNSQPSLTDQQCALLQSWMANYNEWSGFPVVANYAIYGKKTTDEKIHAVSDFVSSHIMYNWSADLSWQIPWQQSSYVINNHIGVCQDEAQLADSLLRSIGIPSRTISGMAGLSFATAGPHSWVQAWDGTRWVTFDPTWDQVYYTTDLRYPYWVRDDYFDPDPNFFAQTHFNGFVTLCW